MMKLRYLFENYDLARTALQNWPHDEEGLDKLLAQFRISSNAIYPFSLNGQIFFLRLAPTEEKREQNLRGELEFLSYLKDCGYPALQPVPALNGKTLLILDTEWGRYYASVFARVPGEQMEDTDTSPKILRAYGASLGKLHTLSRSFTPKTRKWSYQDALIFIQDVLKEYHAPTYMEDERRAVSDALSLLPHDSSVFGLVHYDFELDNVFWDAETETCSAIDFDDGMEHWYALDIEQVFGSLAEELPEERLSETRTVFLEGYRSESPWTEAQARTLPLMRRFCDLFAYARIIRSVQETFPDEPDWMTHVRRKLKARTEEIEANARASRG